MVRSKTNSDLLILMVGLFVVMLGYGVLLPVLPFFLERLMEADTTPENIGFHFGILTAIYPVTLVVLAPFWGGIADKIGPRPLIILGLGGFVLMQLFIGLSTTLLMLYIARITGSMLSSFLIPVINKNISAITTENQRKKAMAWSGTAVSAGVIAGPGISGLLVQNNLHFNWESGHFLLNRFSVPFFFLAGIGMGALLLTLTFLHRGQEKAGNPPLKTSISNPPFNLKNQWDAIGNLLLLSLFLQFSITLFESVFSLYGKEEGGYSSSFIATGLLVCGMVMAIFQPVVTKWGHKVIPKDSDQITGGFIMAGMALLLFVTGTQKWFILLLISLFGIGSSFIVPNLLAAVTLQARISPGNALGWQYSFSGIGQIAGPVGGVALFAVNKNAPFLTGGILLLLIAIYQIIHSKNKQNLWKS